MGVPARSACFRSILGFFGFGVFVGQGYDKHTQARRAELSVLFLVPAALATVVVVVVITTVVRPGGMLQ